MAGPPKEVKPNLRKEMNNRAREGCWDGFMSHLRGAQMAE
jgi:hypothetical protein